MVKVYDSEGKRVENFRKSVSLDDTGSVTKGLQASWNQLIKWLNSQGYWVKGQTTDKGVKIK